MIDASFASAYSGPWGPGIRTDTSRGGCQGLWFDDLGRGSQDGAQLAGGAQ